MIFSGIVINSPCNPTISQAGLQGKEGSLNRETLLVCKYAGRVGRSPYMILAIREYLTSGIN
jgi:hypothetical protein